MKQRNPTLTFLLLISFTVLLSLVFFFLSFRVTCQTRERRVNGATSQRTAGN